MVDARECFGGGVAVITGAAAGIGAGIARYAAELGMTVVLVDIDTAATVRLCDELTAGGATAVNVCCDVRDPCSLESLAANTYSELGPVRLLVNNAGVEQFGYLWDTPVDNWNRLVAINISGVFHGVRAFLPRMLADAAAPGLGVEPVLDRRRGHGTAAGALVMSEHAVLALTECLRLEVDSPDTTIMCMSKRFTRARSSRTSSKPPVASTTAT